MGLIKLLFYGSLAVGGYSVYLQHQNPQQYQVYRQQAETKWQQVNHEWQLDNKWQQAQTWWKGK